MEAQLTPEERQEELRYFHEAQQARREAWAAEEKERWRNTPLIRKIGVVVERTLAAIILMALAYLFWLVMIATGGGAPYPIHPYP
jgi:hypothetical protein